MVKLSAEAKEDLAIFAASDTFKVLLVEMNNAAEAIESDVLKLDILNGDNPTHHLVVKKARAEGARLLISSMTTRLNNLRSKAE